MTVVGWSLGGNWITALLAYLEIFEGVGMTLRSYLNKFILLGMQPSLSASRQVFPLSPHAFVPS